MWVCAGSCVIIIRRALAADVREVEQLAVDALLRGDLISMMAERERADPPSKRHEKTDTRDDTISSTTPCVGGCATPLRTRAESRTTRLGILAIANCRAFFTEASSGRLRRWVAMSSASDTDSALRPLHRKEKLRTFNEGIAGKS